MEDTNIDTTGFVKCSIIIAPAEVMVYLDENWRDRVTGMHFASPFVKGMTYKGEEVWYNLNFISSIKEATDDEWNNWLTRVQVQETAYKAEMEKLMEKNAQPDGSDNLDEEKGVENDTTIS